MKNPEAFPNAHYTNIRGMSLRDYFAAKALANPYTYHDGNPDKVAEWAYSVADAMLKAREV